MRGLGQDQGMVRGSWHEQGRARPPGYEGELWGGSPRGTYVSTSGRGTRSSSWTGAATGARTCARKGAGPRMIGLGTAPGVPARAGRNRGIFHS